MRAILDDDKSLSNATLHTPVEGEPCYDDPDFVWIYDPISGTWGCDGVDVIPDEPDDDEEVEPIDIPGGGGGGGGCSPFDCPPDAPGDGDDDLPPAGVPPPAPPSDDCPEDDDDTPAPPEGGGEPCGLDCWEPIDDDDPMTPPGFMSVQTWQTTSTGMAVAFYQPASADCPGDDDLENPCESEDPPAYCANAGSCFDADVGNEEHHNVLKALESSGDLSAMWNRSADLGGLESFNWIEQDPATGNVSSRPLEGDEGNTLPCSVLTNLDSAPEKAIGYVHTHPKIGETRSCRVDPKNLSKGYIDFEYTESHISQDDLDTVTLHDLDFGIMIDSEVIAFYDSTEIRGAYPRCGF